MDLLNRLQAWHDEVAPTLRGAGYVVEFTGPIGARPKRSASVLVGSTSRIAKLTVWSTGEAELDLGDAVSGAVTEEHREITGDVGLADATQSLVAWVRDA
jgi:hypothetical protein